MTYQTMIYFIVSLFILAVIFMLGPRLNTDVKLKNIDLPDDLDIYLSESESLYSDIKQNTEKKIIWADENDKRPTKISLVYVHGFSASRHEVSPLLENISKKISANIYFTRLSGHARSNDAMGELTLNAMLNDVIEALEIGKRIGGKVVLVGNSTGSTLITWLIANQNIDQIAGAVLLSPNYGLKDPKSVLLTLPWAKHFLPIFEGKTYSFVPDNEIQKNYWTYEYPIQALFPMMALVKLTNELALEKISVPVLMMYSEEDGVVDIGKIKEVFGWFGSVEKRLVDIRNVQGKQKHVLAGDVLSPATTDFVNDEIYRFIDRVE